MMSLAFCIWFVVADAVAIILTVTLGHLWIIRRQRVRDATRGTSRRTWTNDEIGGG